MNWFRNLNAMPRLMTSFGILLALTLLIGFLGLNGLNSANDRMRAIYGEDLKGITCIENIADLKLDMARQDRDAMINIQDASIVKADQDALRADFPKIHENLKEAERYFVTREEMDALTAIQEILPEYERKVMLIVDAIDARDVAGAKARLSDSAGVAADMSGRIKRAIQIKEAAAAERYEINNRAYQNIRGAMFLACLFSLLFGVGLSIFIARGFSAPLGLAVATLEKVAGGDLTVSLVVESKDEVGRMAAALNNALARLCCTLRDVAESAEEATISSQELAGASEAIASGAHEQAASLEETSASLEEMSAAVRLSADNAGKASELASGARNGSSYGHEGTSAIAAMAEISTASSKIADIISTVDEIAFQTNLLAVNAAVEAARAGDEGRGFAVVAAEVRSLAQRSALAAKEIKGLIQDSLRKVERGSELVNRVTQLVSEIAHTSAEQSAGIEQVNTAISQMDQVTQSNSAQTEELSGTAMALAEQATHLMELISAFTLTPGGRSEREKAAYTPRAAEFAAKPNPVVPVRAEVRRPAKKTAVTGGAETRARRVKSPAKQSLVLNAPPPGATTGPAPAGSDSSFEDF
jgi:methyl-accepting chemotaxis protein